MIVRCKCGEKIAGPARDKPGGIILFPRYIRVHEGKMTVACKGCGVETPLQGRLVLTRRKS